MPDPITIDLTDPIGQVRLFSRDSDPANPINSDDEIALLLDTWHNNVLVASAQAVRLMAGDAAKRAKTQKFAGFVIGAGSTLYTALLAYADTLEEQASRQSLPVVETTAVLQISTISLFDTTQNPLQQAYSPLNWDRRPADHW